MLSRFITRATVGRSFSHLATADIGFGFKLPDESRAYVELARKFARVSQPSALETISIIPCLLEP